MMDLTTADLFSRLRNWVDAGALRALDLALTRFIQQQGPETDTAVLLAVALTSERNGHGHVCLDLQGALQHPENLLTRLRDDATLSPAVRTELTAMLSGLTVADWVGRLARSPAVFDLLAGRAAHHPGDWLSEASFTPRQSTPLSAFRASTQDIAPLVLEGTPERPLLYLRRYWQYETRIRQGIAQRLEPGATLPEERMRALLELLFEPDDGDAAEADTWQKAACALAARSAFAIITGGPGTGKTTTVVRLLALLQGLAMGRDEPPLRIRLAAPTGKAAARLNESIAGRVAGLRLTNLPDGEAVRREIPTQVTTLHRLLGPLPDSRHFRHHAGNPLPAELVVVDEASMVDVEMMACLLEALRPDARLILLGDKDQLASVEAGAVLGDLCQRASDAHYTPATRDWLQRVTGATIPTRYQDRAGDVLDQAVVMLRESYRFRAEGGIDALAGLVNEGILDHRKVDDRLSAVKTLFDRQPDTSSGLDQRQSRITSIRLRGQQDPALDTLMSDGYSTYLTAMQTQYPGDAADQPALDDWARAVLKAHGSFQLLTALRQGPWGVEGLNQRIIEVLSRGPLAGLRRRSGQALDTLDTAPIQTPPGMASGTEGWFAGRPVLVTRNDYSLRLMNGDIGMTLEVPVRQGDGGIRKVPRVAFPSGDGTDGIRWILPSRLRAVETVFAMTVHKSQGSEFTHTALILPDAPNPVLTRELLYTGITRSKETFTLLYSREDVLGDALGRRVQRISGISMALDESGRDGGGDASA